MDGESRAQEELLSGKADGLPPASRPYGWPVGRGAPRLLLSLCPEAGARPGLLHMAPFGHVKNILKIFQDLPKLLSLCPEAGARPSGIAANKILQRRHQDRRFPAVFSPETIEAVLKAFDRTEETAPSRREALEEWLKRLPDEPRRLLTLRYEEGLGVEEISRRLNRTLDVVYRALSRIRAALEQCIRRRLAVERGNR